MSSITRLLLKQARRSFLLPVSCSVPIILSSKIMTTPSERANEAVEALKDNPFLEKYAKKIAELQKTSPEELLSRLEAFDKTKKKTGPISPLEKERGFSTPLNAKPGNASPFTKPKVLDDVMKTDMIKEKSPEEIKHIWEDYHKSKDVIAATIPAAVYNKIHDLCQKYPTFLLALPRSKGYEFVVSQFSGTEIHFTPLISYQTHKENAPECLTITHYIDLIEDKKIVLMKGEFNKDILNVTEAQCLANQIQLYYGQDDTKRLQLLDCFTNRPLEFKHMDLIAELECLSI